MIGGVGIEVDVTVTVERARCDADGVDFDEAVAAVLAANPDQPCRLEPDRLVVFSTRDRQQEGH